ncbi:uncharacterized protein LOC143019512 [Oratosquilla oratoria]|uniref:uncharacterized protein LOC143019512 n=1 Tax=Oratosquilla oratoria TaxID=337810 RepID=UPI003F77148D
MIIIRIIQVFRMQPGMRLRKHVLSVPWALFMRESNYVHTSHAYACEFSDENKAKIKKIAKKELTTKHSLAINNKYLFGPLLETQREKKSRIKNEAIGDVKTQSKKRKKRKEKEKSSVGVDTGALINRIENSHYHLVYGSEKENGQVSFDQDDSRLSGVINVKRIQKSTSSSYRNEDYKIENGFGYRDGNISASKFTGSKRKKIIIKKQECDDLVIDNSSSVDEKKELAFSISEKDQKSDEKNNGNNDIQVDFSSASSRLENLINIDNSRWSAAPNSLDLNHIEQFPLYPELTSPAIENSGTGLVQTIGMFEGGYHKLPSVRHILDETMPLANRIALEKWKAKMIAELGEKGFQDYREALLTRGKLFHECIQSELSGRSPIVEEMPTVSGLWTSIRQVLSDVSDVKVIESRVIHPYLYYQGATDCVAYYKGMLVLIEWKTSGKQKLTLKQTYDDPLQVVAYMGALNFDGNYVLPRKVDNALLVVAYDSGLPAHTHVLTEEHLQHYWQEWCKRLKKYWKMKQIAL